MTPKKLKPGMFGGDYSGARPSMTQVKAGRGPLQRGRFILRYSAGAHSDDPGMQWKLCSQAEMFNAVGAGLDFIALSELWETRLEEGAAAGAADGAADLMFWEGRGLAKHAAIYTCWDSAPNPDKYPAVQAYLAAYRKALAGHYQVGLYAGDPALRAMFKAGVIDFGIQPNATSWSGNGLPYAPSHPRGYLARAQKVSCANIWQTGNYWFDKGADEDMILRTPVGSYQEASSGLFDPKPPPKPKPKPQPKPDQPNIDAAEAALKKAQQQHKKPGPVRRAIDAALAALKKRFKK